MNGLKRLGKGIYAFLPHLLITCSVMAQTFYFINRVNEAMNFLTARISTGFQTVYCALMILTAGCALVLHSKARWFGVPCMLGAAVLFVPICRGLMSGRLRGGRLMENFIFGSHSLRWSVFQGVLRKNCGFSGNRGLFSERDPGVGFLIFLRICCGD